MSHCRSTLVKVLQDLERGNVVVNASRFAIYIQACRKLRALQEGIQFHAHVVKSGILKDVYLYNHIVGMYGRCGREQYAQSVFDGMQDRNVFTWTLLISAYACNGYHEKGMLVFRRMLMEGVKPDRVAFIAVLGTSYDLTCVRTMDASITESNFEQDSDVGNCLLHVYGKCGDLGASVNLFCKFKHRNNACTWNSMITVFIQASKYQKALSLFKDMQLQGIKADTVTYVTLLSACTTCEDLKEANAIHCRIREAGGLNYVILGNALVSVYSRCGDLTSARSVFDSMPTKDSISWTAMITAYAQHEEGRDALEIFRKMNSNENDIAIVAVLNSCASLGSLADGRMIHQRITGLGMVPDVGNALVDMYGKCGSIEDAWNVFSSMQRRNVVSWNSILAAHANNAKAEHALYLFQLMQLDGIAANVITFVSVLAACNYVGHAEMGGWYMKAMVLDYKLIPCYEHCNCFADALGRIGELDAAEKWLDNIPWDPGLDSWMALLGACKDHGDVERGFRAAKRALEIDPHHGSAYILLSDVLVKQDLVFAHSYI